MTDPENVRPGRARGKCLYSEVRKHHGDGIDDLHQVLVGILETLYGRGEAPYRQIDELLVFVLSRCFVGRYLGETRDALGLLGVGGTPDTVMV